MLKTHFHHSSLSFNRLLFFGMLCVLVFTILGCEKQDSTQLHTPNLKIQTGTAAILHEIAPKIEEHTNMDSIAESLYSHMRPKVVINNDNLSGSEIDSKTRDYIRTQYAPVFVRNFAQIHADMVKMNSKIAECGAPTVFEVMSGIKQTLCLTAAPNTPAKTVEVQYLTATEDKPLRHSLTFVFTYTTDRQSLILTAIKMPNKSDEKYYIEGL